MSFCKNRFCASAFYFQLCMLCISGTNVKLSMMTRHDSVYSYVNSGNLTWRCTRYVILECSLYIKGLNRFRYHIQRTPLCHQPLPLENLLCLLKDFPNARVSVPRARRIQNFSFIKIFQSQTCKQD